ncbi:phage tail protein [Streptomyces sp. NPDC102264]|uniref:phage tail protein n=1 Tax=Streptomyces sp. NPDC102264 TaxID=3366149 RepID=UPI0037FEE2C8
MLPESIPTVRVSARYLAPDGRPLTGTVEFRPPALLTHADADLFLGGPTVATLDGEGRLLLVLPATDGPGWNPAEWTYTVVEKLTGLSPSRTYQIVLPTARPAVDLADLAPADPSTPNYVAVTGPPGPAGEPGPPGVRGEPGSVHSVNGHTEGVIVLSATDVSAVPADTVGKPGGLATLGTDGLVPKTQLPTGNGAAVASVNGRTGAVVLEAADVGALTQAAADTRYLGIAAAPVTSVNGRTGAISLAAADVAAAAADEAVLLTGDQAVEGAKTFAVPPSTAVNPAGANQLARRGYVDAVSAAGTWSPASMGFSGWAFDPAASSADVAQYCINGWLYLIGIPLHAAATITKVVFYCPGYVGGKLSATSFAGLYTGAGQRVGTVTPTLDKLIPATEGQTVMGTLDKAYTAAAGNYYVALLVNGPAVKTDGPAFMVGGAMGKTPGGSARMPGAFIRHGRLSSTGVTSLPASFTAANVVADSNAIWAALA